MNLNQFKDQVSPELIKKIKACKTNEEMMEQLKAEKIELTVEQLETASGGAHPLLCLKEEEYSAC